MSNVYPVQSGFAGAKQLHGVNPVKCSAYFIRAKTLPGGFFVLSVILMTLFYVIFGGF